MPLRGTAPSDYGERARETGEMPKDESLPSTVKRPHGAEPRAIAWVSAHFSILLDCLAERDAIEPSICFGLSVGNMGTNLAGRAKASRPT